MDSRVIIIQTILLSSLFLSYHHLHCHGLLVFKKLHLLSCLAFLPLLTPTLPYRVLPCLAYLAVNCIALHCIALHCLSILFLSLSFTFFYLLLSSFTFYDLEGSQDAGLDYDVAKF
jgi:hypothetical protein